MCQNVNNSYKNFIKYPLIWIKNGIFKKKAKKYYSGIKIRHFFYWKWFVESQRIIILGSGAFNQHLFSAIISLGRDPEWSDTHCILQKGFQQPHEIFCNRR